MAYELFFDGFETYANSAEMLKFGYAAVGCSIASSSGRRSGKAIAFNFTATPEVVFPISASTHVVAGAAIKARTSVAIQFRNGTTVHAECICTALGGISLSVGGVSIGSAGLFPLDTWMFVELGTVIGGSGTYEIRVNGSSVGWFPSTVADTQNGATTTVNNVRLLGGSNASPNYADDFYITYGNELVWLGDSRVDRLLLTGNTATQDWTPSSGNAWERLNAGDGYVESDVDEATSFFELADLSYNPLAIHGVKVGGLIKKSDAGYREACLLTNSDGTITETSPLALSTDTLDIVTTLKTDPATGLAWNLPGVQALQPGLRVKT